MWKKRLIAWSILLALAAGSTGVRALAEGEAESTPDVPAETAVPETQAAGTDETVDAALCARILRADPDSALFQSWKRTLAHIPYVQVTQKVVRAALKVALGMGGETPRSESLYLVQCTQAPLPSETVSTQYALEFNLHGAIYSDTPITNVTISIKNRAIKGGSIYPLTASVDFPASDNRTAVAFDEEFENGDSLDSLLVFAKMKAGKHAITITVTTGASAEPITIYEANFVNSSERATLTSNTFRDNYDTALRFFKGDTSKFLMGYGFKTRGKRDIWTDETWRDTYIVKSSFGRVHADALPYFEEAYNYLQTSYLRVNLGDTEGKVQQLSVLVDKVSGPYVPRFQSDLKLISHHTFGTSVDINDGFGPNKNSTDNWDVIEEDVRNALTYNGIMTDENGQQFYDFTYTGSYTAKQKGVPKSIVNYLLYELAFYRAGFTWGYYYDHTSDAMHFSLTDGEYYRHMDSEVGLRKVYEYCN